MMAIPDKANRARLPERKGVAWRVAVSLRAGLRPVLRQFFATVAAMARHRSSPGRCHDRASPPAEGGRDNRSGVLWVAAEPLAGTAARRSPPCWHTTRQPDARCARRRRLWRRTTRLELLAAGWREGAVCNRSRRNSPQGDTTRSRGRRRARRACRLAAAAGARHVIAYGLALLGGLVAGVTSKISPARAPRSQRGPSRPAAVQSPATAAGKSR